MIKLNLANVITITICALLGYGLLVTATKIMQKPTLQGVSGIANQAM